MNLRSNVMGNEAHDAFAVCGRQPLARIGEPFGQTINPQPAIGIEHHFDDGGVFQKARDGRAERRAQHPRAALDRLRFLV